MCNLYSLTRNREAILRLIRVSHNLATAFEPLSAIFPGHLVPVVRSTDDGERFVRLQDGQAPRRVTNVRDDKVRSSAFWRASFEERRCLVPASSFCEPKGERPAVWHWFALKGSDARPLFAFPGLWRTYRGPLKRNGEPGRTCDLHRQVAGAGLLVLHVSVSSAASTLFPDARVHRSRVAST
jgi:putative SOS response-associated peptidase YedK